MSKVWPIGRGLRTLSADTLAGTVLAVNVFCFVLGSSSVPRLSQDGHKLRWVALLALLCVAVYLAARERRGRVERPLLLLCATGAWLAALGIVSTAWSAQPHLTLGRSGSLALLFLTAGLLAFAARSRPGLAPALALGVVAATVVVCLIGVAMLVVAHGDAVQPASTQYGARFRGLGLNPDTVAMLEGLAAPIAFWWLAATRAWGARLLALGSLVLLLVTVSASGSRGGLVAMVAGGLVVAAAHGRSWRQRLVLALSVGLTAVAAAAGTTIPKAQPVTAPPGRHHHQPIPTPSVGSSVGAPEPQYAGRLSDELYRIYAGKRSLFSSSGREQALWQGIHQGNARPVLGYGFGLENKVFVDRVYNFQGTFVENSFVGFYLQLGLVGVLSLLAVVATVAYSAVLAARRNDHALASPALAGAAAGGIALMFVQSYVYSVGNVATVAFWTVAFAAAAVAGNGSRDVA